MILCRNYRTLSWKKSRRLKDMALGKGPGEILEITPKSIIERLGKSCPRTIHIVPLWRRRHCTKPLMIT